MGFASRGVTTIDLLKVFPLFVWDVVSSSYAAVAGTWAKVESTTIWAGAHVHNSAAGAVNDRINIGSFIIPTSGLYTLAALARRNADAGKMHIFLNGVDKANIDLYDGAFTENNLETVSLGILAAGHYAIYLEIADKNASSADYLLHLQAIAIYAT